MTLREAFQGLLDSLFKTFAWFADGKEKLFSGNILDLTIGQAILFSLFFFLLLYGLYLFFMFAFLGAYTFINNRKLFKLNLKCSVQGNVVAQETLGKMYANGDGVVQDFIHAYKWYEISWTNGNENGYRKREEIEAKMSSYQITEAQKLAREWVEEHGINK